MRIKRSLIALGLLGWAIGVTPQKAEAAGPPINPEVIGFSSYSITAAWGLPLPTSGYIVQASTTGAFSSILISSITFDQNLSTLTVISLQANTTYFIRVGALYDSGTTDYAIASPTETTTLTRLVTSPTFLQTTSSTIKARWNTLGGATQAAGYLLEVSTHTNFDMIWASSQTADVTVATLTVGGLAPSTTYYARVGGLNWEMIANYVPIGSTVTLTVSTDTIPTGLDGTALGHSSISWTWNTVPGASEYLLYSTSGSVLISSGMASPFYTETGLSTNTAYGRRVTAVVSAVESGLSASATTYTQAAVPGTPSFSGIGSSSVTISWSANNNPTSTPYQIDQSTSGNFLGFTTPVAFAANLTVATTNILGLTSGSTYYYRVRARNGDSVVTVYSSTNSFVTLSASSGSSSGSGTGTASVAPATVQEAGVASSTITFTVPSGGMSAGGRIEIAIPSGWSNALQITNAAQPGYVTVVGGGAYTITTSTMGALVTLNSGSLSSGNQIQVAFLNLYTNCPSQTQPQAQWKLKSAMSSGSALSELTTAPAPQTYVPGPFQSMSFVPWSPMTLGVNQTSPGLVLQASDSCGQPVTLAAPLTINLSGLQSNQSTGDAGVQFSTMSNFSVTATAVTLPASTSTVVFYYRNSNLSNNGWIRASYTHPIYASSYQAWRGVTVLSQSFGFNSISVDNGTPVTGQTSLTITPDADGSNDAATIRFIPSDPNTIWRVTISSNGFQTNVFERWGSSGPLSSLVWNGRDDRTNFVVPDGGVYTVKLEDVNGTASNTALSITVNSSHISGTVTLGGSPVADAMVNANGTTTSGYAAARTNAAGQYTIYGLRAGASYNLFASFYNTSTQAQINSQLSNITAPATGRNFTLASPGIVRVAATSPAAAPVTVYGSINLYTTNTNTWGNLRLLAGSTESDNGDPWNPSTWTVIGVAPGNYTLHLNMQGYGATDQSVTVVAGQTHDVIIPLTARPSVFGKITLPAATPVSMWVPVQGTLQGSQTPTVYGGAHFNVGESTAIYSLFAVGSGSYTFRAQPQGLIPLSLSQFVGTSDIGNSSTGGLDFSGFSVGGNISGTITINGDTTSQNNPMNIWINAFSPQLGQNAFAQIQLATNGTQTSGSYSIGGLANGTYQVNPPYLEGFSASPPGPQSVTVTGGVATLNIVMNENTGRITGSVTLPGANADYNNVHLSLDGPVRREINLSASTYSLDQLDTGYYRLVATYLTTGAEVRQNIGVANGDTQTVPLNLSIPTYNVSGTVSVLSGFTMSDSTGSVVTVNTVTDLLAAATNQTLMLGGQVQYGPSGPNSCQGGTPTTATTARVEAFPKDFDSYRDVTRSVANCFGVGQYKYGTIAANGTYSITGLTPGIWEVSVYPYFDNTGSPNVAVEKQVVTVLSGHVTGTDFDLEGGNSVSGTINLPTGVSDVRTFNLQVVTDRGDTVQTAFLDIGRPGSPASSGTFSFARLAKGNYSLLVQDPGTFDSTLNRNVVRYVAKPAQFQISGGDLTGVDMTVSNASRIVGKLAIQGSNPDGTPALILITPNNTNLLSSNFSISAQANPWVPSGYVQASRGMSSSVEIDSNNQFSIDGMIAGTYDVYFKQFSYGSSTQGSLDLAAYTQGGVVVPQGQTLDLGTITLQPGLAVSGLVTDTSGTPLSNIRVRAYPSNNQHGNDGQEVFTNSVGRFTFTGLSPKVKVYDFIAAPRPHPSEKVQPVPYGQMAKRAVDVTQVPPPTLSFSLPAATAGFIGTVQTVDGGALYFPSDEQSGYPAAAIYVKLQGDPTGDDPLGDENATALNGSFNITHLPAGVYDLTIMSLGYRPVRMIGVTLTSTPRNLGTITLQKGPSLTATLAKPDGSAVNTSDVRQAVAASADLSSIIFGQINSDAQTNNILSIKFAGFELSPKVYSILLFDSRDNIIVPSDGRNIVFTANNDSAAKTLTFQPTAPVALTNIQKSGDDVLLTFYFSRPLRNGIADQDPTDWLNVASGAGTLTGTTLSGDRRQLSTVYTPAAGEQNATIQFSANTVDIDASTGVEYVISKTVALLLGQKATAEQTINPAIGGDVSLSDALDPTNVTIPANALLNTNGTAADATSSYDFTLSATDDASSVGAGALAGAPRVASMMAKGPSAYVSEAYAAMQLAKAQAVVNPLSSFYSILLPAGLSHTLNQTATLTLHYDSTADPNSINVYYFNGSQYILEQALRTVDTVNRTISVGVSHFSTFVVLENNAPIVQVNGDSSSAADIEVFNFPNPFDLNSKTKTLTHGGATTSITTEGTIIRYAIPASKAALAQIEIYNVVGDKVRTIDLGAPTTGTFNYVEWDGRNNSGKKVASGVYIGMLKVGGEKKFFKMAVIK
jgi:hypothetical protein